MQIRKKIIYPSNTKIIIDEKSSFLPNAYFEFKNETFKKWDDAVSLFGIPGKCSNEEQFQNTIDDLDRLVMPLRNRSALILSDKSTKSLRSKSFNEVHYAERIFGNQNLQQIILAIDLLQKETQNVSNNKTILISENIHFFLKALSNLIQDNEKSKNKEMLEISIEKLLHLITNIIEKAKIFYDPLNEESFEASNASSLLSSLSKYAFLFKFPREIENYKNMGQFDEIIKIIQKVNSYSYLQSLPLFVNVLNSIDSSLRKLYFYLKEDLKKMSMSTYNKNHLKLVLSIEHKGNLILEILQSLVERVESNKSSIDLLCQQFEDSLSLFNIICSFYKEFNLEEYVRCLSEIEKLMFQMINFFEEIVMIQIEENNKKTVEGIFNTELHLLINKIVNVLKNANFPKSSYKKINGLNEHIILWYRNHLKQQTNFIYKNWKLKLDKFLIAFIDNDSIFGPNADTLIIKNSILSFYDYIHEMISIKGINHIHILEKLRDNTGKNLENIIDHCLQHGLKEKCFNDLNIVGIYLEKLLIDMLIKQFFIDINPVISSIFVSFDWESNNLEKFHHSWVSYLLNKFISAKCKWGEIFQLQKNRIIDGIASSIYYNLTKINRINSIGIHILRLDVMIFIQCFGKESSNLWEKIEIHLNKIWNSVSHETLLQKISEDFETLKHKFSFQIEAILSME